jgi:hypothetical protein
LKPALLCTILLIASPIVSAAPPPKPLHLKLQAYPAAAFPFLSKLGSVDVDLYPQGVSFDGVWIDAFAKTGADVVTVKNPLARVYRDVPFTELAPMLAQVSPGGDERIAVGILSSTMAGTVKGLAATRYRIQYGPQAWADVWMTSAIPVNAQFRAIAIQFIRGVAPATATIIEKVPGTPVYVELNFRRFTKVVVLKVVSADSDLSNAEGSLGVGSFYFRSPSLDALWK